MQDQLRDSMAAYLSRNWLGVLTSTKPVGLWTMPVRYRSQGIEVDCLLPRWADLVYHLEQEPQVALVITIGNQVNGLSWLHYLGLARLVSFPWTTPVTPETLPALTNVLYQVIHLSPQRIDLIEEQGGRTRRETLEILGPYRRSSKFNIRIVK